MLLFLSGLHLHSNLLMKLHTSMYTGIKIESDSLLGGNESTEHSPNTGWLMQGIQAIHTDHNILETLLTEMMVVCVTIQLIYFRN